MAGSRWTAIGKRWPPGQSALYTCNGRYWKRSDTAEADSADAPSAGHLIERAADQAYPSFSSLPTEARAS
jgi:hypothetical protein